MKHYEAVKICEGKRREYDIPENAKLDSVEKRYIELPEDVDSETAVNLHDELVWACSYLLGVRFYELSCDMTGQIVRVRKSR